jgi:hypothetical protein
VPRITRIVNNPQEGGLGAELTGGGPRWLFSATPGGLWVKA